MKHNFRALPTSGGKVFVKGGHCEIDGKHYIIPSESSGRYHPAQLEDCDGDWLLYGLVEVIPETVGMWTGLHDKNGKEIYAGDIIESHSEMVNIGSGEKTGRWVKENYVVEWANGDGRFGKRRCKNDRMDAFSLSQDSLDKFYTIIGTIHTTPGLMKEAGDE